MGCNMRMCSNCDPEYLSPGDECYTPPPVVTVPRYVRINTRLAHRFAHNCKNCLYIGQFGDKDVYLCAGSAPSCPQEARGGGGV